MNLVSEVVKLILLFLLFEIIKFLLGFIISEFFVYMSFLNKDLSSFVNIIEEFK